MGFLRNSLTTRIFAMQAASAAASKYDVPKQGAAKQDVVDCWLELDAVASAMFQKEPALFPSPVQACRSISRWLSLLPPTAMGKEDTVRLPGNVDEYPVVASP